mgnify:FL=1
MQILIIIFVAIPIIISLTVLFSIGLCREFNYLQNKSVVLNKKKQLKTTNNNIEEETSNEGTLEKVEAHHSENTLEEVDEELDDERISVYNKIIEKAMQEASEIKENGNQKAQMLIDQTLKETEEKINQMLEEAKAKNADLIKTKNAEFDQVVKQQVLANQKRIIKETFEKALEKLTNMTDEELNNYVVSHLQKAQINNDVTIKVNKNDYTKYQTLFSTNHDSNLDILTKELNLNNVMITLSNDSVDIVGGFIIACEYFDIDNSYEVILNNLSEELETTIAEILFKSEE